MIWSRRLRMNKEESTWALPFADLMTLLLVIFVLIVSMSDLRAGRLNQAGQSVRSALGYKPAGDKPVSPAVVKSHTLRDQLEEDIVKLAEVRLTGPHDEALPPCEISGSADELILHVAADDAFMGPTAILAPRTRKLIACIADHLRDGRACLRVRGYGPDGVVPPGLPYRDRMDIACERARAVRQELLRAGMIENRLTSAATEDAAGGRGFEIIIPADPGGRPLGNARESADGHG